MPSTNPTDNLNFNAKLPSPWGEQFEMSMKIKPKKASISSVSEEETNEERVSLFR